MDLMGRMALLGAALLAIPLAASAQGSGASGDGMRPQGQTEVEGYWTPERLRRAQPRLAQPSGAAPSAAPLAVPDEPPESGPGAPPSVVHHPRAGVRLLPANARRAGAELQAGVSPLATSSYGARFTTGRVFPDAALLVYPYSTAGELFFTEPGVGDFVCSAAVLRPRIVVTAGHCAAHPSTVAAQRYFFTNFLFVPAYNAGAAPFGSWTASDTWVTNDWYFSDGSFPNPQDVAMLITNDQAINSLVQTIGATTGYLGYQTKALAKNNVTMLGYPCNLDSCSRMEITNATAYKQGGNNTFIFGSAMASGASGGPWIQDFGVNPISNPVVALGGNYLVSVTSYGPTDTSLLYLGASVLDHRFVSLLNTVCGLATGNC